MSIPRRDNSGIFSSFFGMIYPWVQVIVGGAWVSFFRTLVRLENVGDEILVHVHVVVHGNCCKSRVTQNPADFSDLGSLIRQPFFHLACNLFCVVHLHFLVSHAPIISDRRRLVKANQGLFLLPIYIIGIIHPLASPFLRFCQSSCKLLAGKDLRRGRPGPPALSPYTTTLYNYSRKLQDKRGIAIDPTLPPALRSRDP